MYKYAILSITFSPPHTQLSLQGLKNLSLDPSLQNGSTKAIISYLKSRHTRSVPYYHMKLMIVGAAAKGKTTLLHQIMSEKTVQSPKGGFDI